MPPSPSTRTPQHAADNTEFQFTEITNRRLVALDAALYIRPEPTPRTLRFLAIRRFEPWGWEFVEYQWREITYKPTRIDVEWIPNSKARWETLLRAFFTSRSREFMALSYRKESNRAPARGISQQMLDELEHYLDALRRMDGRSGESETYRYLIWAEDLCTTRSDTPLYTPNGQIPLTEDTMFRFARMVVVLPHGPGHVAELDGSDGQLDQHAVPASVQTLLLETPRLRPVDVLVLHAPSVSAGRVASPAVSSSASSSSSSSSVRTVEGVRGKYPSMAKTATVTPLLPPLPGTPFPASSTRTGLRLRLSPPGVPRGAPLTNEMQQTLLRLQGDIMLACGSATSAPELISVLAAKFAMPSPPQVEKARAGDGSVADRERQTAAVAEFLEDFMARIERVYSVCGNVWLGVFNGRSAGPWEILGLVPDLNCPAYGSPLCLEPREPGKSPRSWLQRNDEEIKVSFEFASPCQADTPMHLKICDARAWRAYRVRPSAAVMSTETEKPPAPETSSAGLFQLDMGCGGDQWRFTFDPSTSQPGSDKEAEVYWIVYVGDLETYRPATSTSTGSAAGGGRKSRRVMVAEDIGRDWFDEAGDPENRRVLVRSWSLLEVDDRRGFDVGELRRRNFTIPVWHF
ncbi:hypothetical protein OH76DRAFT_1421545 [Lentinus brumalis]|uniref:Uncharacterized protein n=1 Tax=Lentinus brumalis TaxID=2498619 RepID=A0A371CV17_9APHY|nr:hypothetical protein OH76DRAFT_1421545 [Polyporus brumalis]